MSVSIKVIPTIKLMFDEENDFGIYGCNVNSDDSVKVRLNKYGNISIKGNMPKLEIGVEYNVELQEDLDSKYDGSYDVVSINREVKTLSQQKAFLKSILTENQVKNIYEVYNEDDNVIELIKSGEFDYDKVKNLGEKTFEKLKDKVVENSGISEALAFLHEYGVTYNTIKKLVKFYKGSELLIKKVNENPYVLTEVEGIGFKKADAIAKSIGYSMTSPHRIKSCIMFCIEEENLNGHSWIPYEMLMSRCVDLLNINKKYINTEINNLEDFDNENDKQKIINKKGKISKRSIYLSELNVSKRIKEMTENSTKVFEDKELDKLLDDYCERNSIELEENQRQFFYDWNENNILALVGGGGVGKSWLQNILLELIKDKGLSTMLLAPTGRASKVMKNYTGREAYTIHRVIAMTKMMENPEIYADVVIIDESSMCDISIVSKFLHLLKNKNARLLFVGDDFQIPSVGVGNFLYDVLNSNVMKVTRLKKVFRQDDGGILNVATDIRENNAFLNSNDEGRKVFGKDCVFWLVDQEYIKEGIIKNYEKAIKKFNKEDVVILTPTNKGELGTVELNKEIQKIANPKSPNKKEKIMGSKKNEKIFRVGDHIMNTENEYDVKTLDGGYADIFNGDSGVIVDIDEKEKVCIVNIDNIMIPITFNKLYKKFIHSWAISIHKSQGSQFKVVIIVIDRSMTYQLNANLMYTGFSRASEYMLVLTQSEVVRRAMNKFVNMERRSFLREMLT